ncbi:MAG: hypothetical protein U9N09_01925 [Euryarchaeota archaeon]|nr:hypothetical protein [Euryarchaeota archaeon]
MKITIVSPDLYTYGSMVIGGVPNIEARELEARIAEGVAKLLEGERG